MSSLFCSRDNSLFSLQIYCKPRTPGHLETNHLNTLLALGCLSCVLHGLFLMFQNQNVMSLQQAQPLFSPEEEEEPHVAREGKNKEELTSWQVSVCVLTSPLSLLGVEARQNLFWWEFPHGYGCSGFSTWEYGAVKEL